MYKNILENVTVLIVNIPKIQQQLDFLIWKCEKEKLTLVYIYFVHKIFHEKLTKKTEPIQTNKYYNILGTLSLYIPAHIQKENSHKLNYLKLYKYKYV